MQLNLPLTQQINDDAAGNVAIGEFCVSLFGVVIKFKSSHRMSLTSYALCRL